MQRTLKFRAWWKHPQYMPQGHMYYVGGLIFATKQDGEPEFDYCGCPKEVGLMGHPDNSKIGWNDAQDCTLMQFTGLHDKNGKEIYEGDIVRGVWNGDIYQVELTFDWIHDYVEYASEPLEIIGNIHENPDLLSTNTKGQ